MKIFYKVHGFVQGVGYRSLVVGAAIKHGIKGIVRNAEDGSVEIFAVGKERDLQLFEKEINVHYDYGPKVMQIEKRGDAAGSDAGDTFKGFRIED